MLVEPVKPVTPDAAPVKPRTGAPLSKPPPQKAAKGFATRYYLGTAFEPLARYLASSPPAWQAIRAQVGFWNHGMGVTAAEKAGFVQQYVSAFGVKQMLFEADLKGSAVDNPVLVKTPWVQAEVAIRHSGNSLKSSGYFPLTSSGTMANSPEEVVRRYKLTFAGYDASAYRTNNFVFWTPPGKMEHLDKIMAPYKGYTSIVDYVVAATKAAGVAVDYPWRYMLHGGKDQIDKLLRVAKQLRAETTKRGGALVCVFDGGGKSADVVAAARVLAAAGVRPDVWVVDQFNPITTPGLTKFYGPEEAVKQMAALIQSGL